MEVFASMYNFYFNYDPHFCPWKLRARSAELGNLLVDTFYMLLTVPDPRRGHRSPVFQGRSISASRGSP